MIIVILPLFQQSVNYYEISEINFVLFHKKQIIYMKELHKNEKVTDVRQL